MKFLPLITPDLGFDLHVRTWGWRGKRYSFVISKLYEEDFYTCSWQNHSISPTHSIRIEGQYTTMQQAEAKCRMVFKELNNKN